MNEWCHTMVADRGPAHLLNQGKFFLLPLLYSEWIWKNGCSVVSYAYHLFLSSTPLGWRIVTVESASIQWQHAADKSKTSIRWITCHTGTRGELIVLMGSFSVAQKMVDYLTDYGGGASSEWCGNKESTNLIRSKTLCINNFIESLNITQCMRNVNGGLIQSR